MSPDLFEKDAGTDLIDRSPSGWWEFEVSFSLYASGELPEKSLNRLDCRPFFDPTVHYSCNPLEKSPTCSDVRWNDGLWM
jgi:hypothetical protein